MCSKKNMKGTNLAGSKNSKSLTISRTLSSAYSAKTSTRRVLAAAPLPFVLRAGNNDDSANPEAPAAKVD